MIPRVFYTLVPKLAWHFNKILSPNSLIQIVNTKYFVKTLDSQGIIVHLYNRFALGADHSARQVYLQLILIFREIWS